MIVSAGFIIFRRVKTNPVEYLLLQSPDKEHYWGLPKGHLENDETPLQAAERETKEEAGLDTKDFESYKEFEEIISYPVRGQSKTVCYYLGQVYDPQQKITVSNEHQDYIWSNLQDACNLVTHEPHQSLLKKMSLTSIFDRICASRLVIVSQQRNEPDLTREQKHQILHQLYTTNPAAFVYRFGTLLTDRELTENFDSNADYVRHITKSNREKIQANRRYTYMQQLLANGTYFGDEAMKERSPLLYEQMIGKYSDQTTQPLVARTASGPLADFYMEHLEALNHQERVVEELENEERLRDEDDSESDDDEEKKYSNAERDLYRQEFLAIQKEKFLNGEDSNIDYATIDNDESLDDIKIRERDEEEKYFDDEDPYTYSKEKS